jgi:hypothetical protein
MKSVARNFIKDPLFVGNPKDLALYGKLKKLKKWLNELERDKEVTKAEMIKIIEDAFGTKPDGLVRNKILDVPMASLRDSIIAIKLLPEEHHRPIEDLTNYLRDLEVIMKFVSGKDFPGDGKLQLYKYFNSLITMFNKL